MSVEVAGLTHRYGERIALSEVSFTVPRGQVFGLAGPNGGGKTTLFRILSTSMAPTSGTVRILETDLADRRAVRPRLGVVFQSPSLDRKLTVRENLLHHGHLYGWKGKVLRERIAELLEQFGLADRTGDRVETLSGGLQRRVELAKGVLHKPEVLLLDEPSTGLDPGARKMLWEHLRGLEGVTILLTTHLMEEAERCDAVGILHQGKLAALGAPEALRAEVGGDVVTIRSREAEALKEELAAKFGVAPEAAAGAVRLTMERGPEFVARMAEAFPGRFDSVTVARPSLEDVFHLKTGQVFES